MHANQNQYPLYVDVCNLALNSNQIDTTQICWRIERVRFAYSALDETRNPRVRFCPSTRGLNHASHYSHLSLSIVNRARKPMVLHTWRAAREPLVSRDVGGSKSRLNACKNNKTLGSQSEASNSQDRHLIVQHWYKWKHDPLPRKIERGIFVLYILFLFIYYFSRGLETLE